MSTWTHKHKLQHIVALTKTDPEHFQPLSSQCDMHVKLPHQATFALPEACFPASMGSKSPKKYKEWMKVLLWPHLTKIENDQKIRKTFLKNLIVVLFFNFRPLVKVIILPMSRQNRGKRDRLSRSDVLIRGGNVNVQSPDARKK